jgi:gluconate 2-dehydrogenase gamma chain
MALYAGAGVLLARASLRLQPRSLAMSGLSRRIFLKATGAAAAVTGVAADAAAPPAASAATATPPAGSASAPAARAYLFLNAQEAAFIEAAVDRLIPPDALGPSGTEAAVHEYIDLQLAGAWGTGERLYRSGPWRAGSPTQGYQLPFTPAELFRTALRGIRADLQKNGRAAFEQLPGQEQDAYLTLLQTSSRELEGVPAKVFFETLLGMTVEGYFCDPVYGGNKGMAAWRMIGFPGAYAAYYELVDQYGRAFNQPPRSLAERGGTVHVMPDIPPFVHGDPQGAPLTPGHVHGSKREGGR